MSRILLADDSPHAQRMGERILREEGFEVVTVTDGQTALLRMADVDPDLVFADVSLPRKSGYEICQEVKSLPLHKHVRVILTAGLLEAFDEAQAAAVHSDGVIKKPFESSVVLETVKPLIEAARKDRAAAAESVVEPPLAPQDTLPQSREPDVVVEPLPDSASAMPFAAAPVISEPITPARDLPEPITHEPVTSEAIKLEPAASGPAKPEPVKSEPVRFEPAKLPPEKPEPAVDSERVKPEPLKSDPVESEPVKLEPAAAAPVESTQVGSGPASLEPITPAPVILTPGAPAPKPAESEAVASAPPALSGPKDAPVTVRVLPINPDQEVVPGPVEAERIRAAVVLALDAALPRIIDEITERVLVALGH